ncbi:protein dachsous-like [Octopus vulgaris]|uniref:Protein dachsous-like n=1 Tax=Octopus vulgaris TaxID=6645 RepID=A0AA36F620_OCTVU|nr:protein dachsous-like [Octopus vulgaris]
MCIYSFVSASDPDCGFDSKVSYKIADGMGYTKPSEFKVESATGRICIAKSLDYEKKSVYEFPIKAIDGDGFYMTAIVKIFIQDINDNIPEFYPLQYNTNLDKDTPPGTTVITVQATDKDTAKSYGDVGYSFLSGNGASYFHIYPRSGVIILAKRLSMAPRSFTLKITAVDGEGLRSLQPAVVTVSIPDRNVPVPIFTLNKYSFSVSEAKGRGTEVGQVHASISSSAHAILYSIVSGDRLSLFRINSTSGMISVANPLDHDTLPSVLLNIQAASGNPAVFGTTQVNITITDINDNAPRFIASNLTISVREDKSTTQPFYTVLAHDLDSDLNGQITYRLYNDMNGLFWVDSKQGHLWIRRELDYERKKNYTLEISARDHGIPSLYTNLSVFIQVLDINDNRPYFDKKLYERNVTETTFDAKGFGSVLASDKDSGANGLITYHLKETAQSKKFGIYPNDSVLYVREELDRELKDVYFLTVIAVDNGAPSLTASTNVRVTVLDANDNSPVFTRDVYNFNVVENKSIRSLVGVVSATDRDIGPNARLNYSIRGHTSEFAINPSSGEISIWHTLDHETRTHYNFTVRVNDKGKPSRSSSAIVKINVLDVNDNAPRFLSKSSVSVAENMAKGTPVLQVLATDPDARENGIICYYFDSGQDAGTLAKFAIHPKNGQITTREVLDYESHQEYVLSVVARDNGNPPKENYQEITVSVIDDTEEKPLFPAKNISFSIPENVPIRTLVGVIDKQNGNDGVPEFYLTGGNIFSAFTVSVDSGAIYTIREIDYEESSTHILGIKVVYNGRYSVQSTNLTIIIHVVDINDNAPKFNSDPVKLSVPENTPIGTSLYTFVATDLDSESNGSIVYRIEQLNEDLDRQMFSIDSRSGELTVNEMIDYEKIHSVSLVLIAQDLSPDVRSRLSSSITVLISVLDENDNVPQIASAMRITVSEEETVGFPLTQLIAVDADSMHTGNGIVTYNIIAGNTNEVFRLNANNGLLTLAKKLDRENEERYELNITAQDQGIPQQMSYTLLTIEVEDSNDNTPKFKHSIYYTEVLENARINTTVVQIEAYDLDAGANGQIKYLIPEGTANNMFSINPLSGIIQTRATLDREQKMSYLIIAYAVDDGYPMRYDTATVMITVTDVNDHNPMFKLPSYHIVLSENQRYDVIRTFVAYDSDQDMNGKVTYRIANGNVDNIFSVDSDTGALSCRPLDREMVSFYNLTLVAEDGGSPSRTGRTHILVTVKDMNDNVPIFRWSEYSRMLPEDIGMGTYVMQVNATDADEGPNQNITYALANDTSGLFSLNSTTGIIHTIGYFDREKRSVYNFVVVATDGSLYESPHTARVPVEVLIDDVNDNRPAFPTEPFRKTVSDNVGADQSIFSVEATDNDIGRNQVISYTFGPMSDPSSQDLFRISSNSGVIRTKRRLSKKDTNRYFLQVIATDNGGPRLSSAAVLEITVGLPGLDNNLHFVKKTYYTPVEENSRKGLSIQNITATYKKQIDSSVNYYFISGNEDAVFHLNNRSGEISVQDPDKLDYETVSKIRLIVMAKKGSERAYASVNIAVIDKNDHPPVFTQQHYVSYVWENDKRNTLITKVVASDSDAGRNSQIRYSIISGDKDGVFHINRSTGVITTTSPSLDREIYSSYQLKIEADDNGRNYMSSTCIVQITVVDKNDNTPVLPRLKPLSIPEDTVVGSTISMVTANVADLNPNLSYNITSTDGMFNVDHLTGEVTLAKPLDYNKQKTYNSYVIVKNDVSNATVKLQINVLDTNNHAPEFSESSYQVSVKENAYVGKPIFTVTALDSDSGKNADITYKMDVQVPEFYINPKTGTIHVNKTLTYNPNKSFIQLVVVAEDGGTPRLSTVVGIYVQIFPVYNTIPSFPQLTYRHNVKENISRGTVLLDVKLPKSTSLTQNRIFYKIVQSEMQNVFSIGRRSGEIVLNSMLDREKIDDYSFTVMAMSGHQSSTVNVDILVDDINDQRPVFDQAIYHVVLNESFLSNVSFCQVQASDRDVGNNGRVAYAITSGNDNGLFRINRETGRIFITAGRHLDYESQTSHKLVVRAIDCVGCKVGESRLMTFTSVVINVTDVNESPPRFPLRKYIEFIAENEPVTTRIFQAHANDEDKYEKMSYHIFNNDYSYFYIDKESGWVHSSVSFDYESRTQYTFQLLANDSNGQNTTIKVTVNILSVDEYTPKFKKKSYSFEIRGDADVGDYVGEVNATDEDKGEDGRIFFQLGDPASPFLISPINGSIYVRENLRGIRSGHQSTSRRKRDTKETESNEKYEDVSLVVLAGSGKSNSKTTSTKVNVKIDRGCIGCNKLKVFNPEPSSKKLVIIIVAVLVSLIIISVCILLFLLFRRRYRKRKPRSAPPAFNTAFEVPPPVAPRHTGPPSYQEVVHCNGHSVNIARSEVLSDRSGNSTSSGRGSAEEEEDEEIRMINSNTCIQSQTLSRKNKMPDSGIQQDDDSCSEPPVQNHQEYFARLGIDTARIQAKAKAAAVAPSVDSIRHYQDEGGGDSNNVDNFVYEKLGDIETDDELSIIENSRDQGFHDAEPHQVASLSSVVNSEEEYSGSYNWDYLLDWGPQYMPLADVFAEIAQLKDEENSNFRPKKQPVHMVPQRFVNSTLNANIRTVPPPIITDAPPRMYKQGSKHSSHTAAPGGPMIPSSRTNAPLPPLPRSPITHESFFPSPALTPSFSPSLSPLATKCPSLSPVVSSRGASSSGHSSAPNMPGRAHAIVKQSQTGYIASPDSEQEIRI